MPRIEILRSFRFEKVPGLYVGGEETTSYHGFDWDGIPMVISAECDADRHHGGIWSCLDHIFLSETDAVLLRAELLSIAVSTHKIKEHILSSNRHLFCPPDTAMMSIRITFCRYYHRYSISIDSMITRRLFTADIESRYFFEAKWSQDFDSRHDFASFHS